ncbi:lipocalin-like domain-containing protein [Pseudomonas fluorescens]|nr:lipocalin-like domain-containing protein [Pseudomonas fluorescens]
MKHYVMASLLGVGLAALFYGGVHASESPLVGAWRLVGYQVESQDTHQKIPAMGDRPTGRVIFTADHRVAFVLTGEGRQVGTSDAEKSALLSTLIAYTGIERVDGNQWCTLVDSAWNPAWVGTEQCRDFRVQGDTLQVLTPWRQMPNWPGTTRSIITFERDK